MTSFSQISKKNRRGIVAAEIVISVALVATILLYSIDAVSRFLKTGSGHTAQVQAVYITEGTLESVRFIRDAGWSAFQALPLNTDLYVAYGSSTITATTTPQLEGVYSSVFRISGVSRDATTKDIVSSGGTNDTGTRLVIATTTWTGGAVSLVTYLAQISP